MILIIMFYMKQHQSALTEHWFMNSLRTEWVICVSALHDFLQFLPLSSSEKDKIRHNNTCSFSRCELLCATVYILFLFFTAASDFSVLITQRRTHLHYVLTAIITSHFPSVQVWECLLSTFFSISELRGMSILNIFYRSTIKMYV